MVASLRARGRGSPRRAWGGNGGGFTRHAVDDHGVGLDVVGAGRDGVARMVYDLDKFDGLDDAGLPRVVLRRLVIGAGLAEL